MPNMKHFLERGRNALGRVFVRSTVYVVVLLLAFTTLVACFGYFSQVWKIEERLAENARNHAVLVSRIAAREIENKNYANVEKLLDALGDEALVVAAKAYTRFGHVFASDLDSRTNGALQAIDEDVLDAIQGQTTLTRETDAFHQFVLPVYRDGIGVGAVEITMSKQEIQDLKREIVIQTLILAGTLFFVFVPLATFLMYRSTHGISRVTEAANEAAQGFLDTKMKVDTVGEVGELQEAFRQMAVNFRNNIQRVEYLAHVDGVTGLPNRLKFSNVAAQLIDLSPKAEGGMIFIDLDRFKAINDMHGHVIGDRLLALVAERLSDLVKAFVDERFQCKPFIARFTGDEFIVVLPGVADPEALKELSDLIVSKIRMPFSIDHLKLMVRASVGVALYPQDGKSADDVLRCADMAMFTAKDAGRDQTVIFDESIRQKADEREKIERCLRTALDHDELTVFYQPKVDIETGQIMGSEALLRWEHPDLGSVPPWKFIPLAEECGLMPSIGEFVLRQSLEDMNVVRKQGFDLSVAVNVAPIQFQSDSFTDRTLGILGESGFPLDKLELEITESSIMEDPQRVYRQIVPIRDEGVEFAIDDFGTGYSSLNTLATMPFDTLKIDRSFVMNMAESEDRRVIVQLILMMAQQLRMKTVAEGIETRGQYDHLKAWGANFAQGYLWSPPVPFAAFKAMVRAGLDDIDVDDADERTDKRRA